MKAMRMILLAAALLAPCPGAAQAHVEPGSPLLDASRIQAGIETLVHVRPGNGGDSLTYMLLLDTRHAGAAGRETIIRAERVPVQTGSFVLDSFAVVRRTLAPVFTKGAQFAFTFNRTTGGKFYINSIDLVLRALPLADGFSAMLPTYDPVESRTFDRRVIVEGVEDVPTVDGGVCRAWRVHITGRDDDAQRFWISAASHALVRHQRDGASDYLVRMQGCAAPDASRT